jgi:hypothetical protein
MSKPKIQPLAPLQLRISNIPRLLLFRHPLPNSISALVDIHVINLCQDKHDNHDEVDDEQVSISAVVFGFVVIAVDEEGCYVAYLDGHLFYRC